MNQLLFPLIIRLEGAANIRVPNDIVQGLARNGMTPDQINRLMWQYKMWKFMTTLTQTFGDNEEFQPACCVSCGDYIKVTQKQSTKTCSPRCHKIYKRHEITPFQQLVKEAIERVHLVEQMAQSSNNIDLTSYPWHQVLDGWTYALHD